MKRVVVLVAALLCCTSSVFASDSFDVPWIDVDLSNFTVSDFTLGSNRFSLTGVRTSYNRNSSGVVTTLSSEPVSDGCDFSANPTLDYKYESPIRSVQLSTYPWSCDSYSGYHYQKFPESYYYDSFTTLSWKASGVWFYSDIWLEPGFYEIDCAFNIDSYLIDDTAGSSTFYRTSVTDISFSDGIHHAQVMKSPTHSTKFTVELENRSQLIFSSSYPSGVYDFTGVTSPRTLRMTFVFNLGHLRYRSIPYSDIQALSDATDGSNISQDSYDQFESQWTGSMTDNFNALSLGDFSFPSGLLSAFSFISSIFTRLWNAMGVYSILYTFPLFLGIVLLLIGRISKFSGGQSSSKSNRGNDDA